MLELSIIGSITTLEQVAYLVQVLAITMQKHNSNYVLGLGREGNTVYLIIISNIQLRT